MPRSEQRNPEPPSPAALEFAAALEHLIATTVARAVHEALEGVTLNAAPTTPVRPGAAPSVAGVAELLTVPEVAGVLRVGRHKVERFIRGGQLKATKYGNAYRVHRRDLEAFMHDAEERGRVAGERMTIADRARLRNRG